MQNAEKLALTVPQTAKALGFAEATVWKYVADGTIPSFKLGKSRRIPVDALREWMEQQAHQPIENQSVTAA